MRLQRAWIGLLLLIDKGFRICSGKDPWGIMRQRTSGKHHQPKGSSSIGLTVHKGGSGRALLMHSVYEGHGALESPGS